MRLNRSFFLVGSLVVSLLCFDRVQTASGEESVGLTDNLFFDLAGGAKRQVGEDGVWFGSLGFNWGIPLVQKSEGIAVGFQIGGDVSLSKNDAEWDATIGPFVRNVKVGDEQVAVAVLVDYYRTTYDIDLWAVRPILGVTLGSKDAVGLTGVIGLNDEEKTFFGGSSVTIARQTAADSVIGFWNRYWNEEWMTELSAGYMFDDVDEVVFGGRIVYALNRCWDISLGGELSGNGDYVGGLRLSYHFGGLGRHDAVHNIYAWNRPDCYTPFPKRVPSGLFSHSHVASYGGGGD